MACPRCGGKSKNPSNPAGRCSACLAKLSRNRKNPNRWEHYDKKADDALRRQKGKSETAHATHKGNGSRKEMIRKLKEGYRKYGKSRNLSLDRKDNSKGYSSENVRTIPNELNRGRHHADAKKIKKWKESLGKSLSLDDFMILLEANALRKGLEFDSDLVKAEMFCDKGAIIDIVAQEEANLPDAEELLDFIEQIDQETIASILNEQQ